MQQPHQLAAEPETAIAGDERPLAVGRVTAYGQHVLDPDSLVLANLIEKVVDREIPAGEVCHRQQTGLLADPLDETDRAIVARAAPGTVGHRDECRVELAQRGDGGEETLGAVVVLRWEELEGEEGFPAREEAIDAHPRMVS